jgi:hypothetical protein
MSESEVLGMRSEGHMDTPTTKLYLKYHDYHHLHHMFLQEGRVLHDDEALVRPEV